MRCISRTGSAACAALVLGAVVLGAVVAIPAWAGTTKTRPTAHCSVGKLGLVVPVDDPQDPIAEFDATVDLTGTVPDSVQVGDTYPVTVGIDMQVTDADLAAALNAIGGSVTGSEPGSNVGVSFLDESGAEVGGDATGYRGDPPTISLDGDTFSFESTLSGEGVTAQVPGTVTYFLGTFDTELTLTAADGTSDSVDLWCSLTADLPEIGTVVVQDAGGPVDNPPGGGDQSPPPGNHPTGPGNPPATHAPSPTPTPQAKQNLANTGAGNAVPLTVAGIMLVLAGAGMVLFVRRRRPLAGGSDIH